jgi:(E)-4-hydroxy-3-methylbut-2-enyl-diphosphate synthase
MVTAYRLLVKRMAAETMDYPLHLGVTEAGVGEDARIKSAVGIGALLEEGIGDTVRVSLTEDSIHEIPVAGALIAPYNQKFYFSRFYDATHDAGQADLFPSHLTFLRHDGFPMTYERRPSRPCGAQDLTFGGSGTVRVWTNLGAGFDAIVNASTGETRFEGVEMTRETYSAETARSIAVRGLATGLISDDADFLANAKGIAKLVLIVRKPEPLAPLAAACAKMGSHLELCFDAMSGLIQETGFEDALKNLTQALKRTGFANFSFGLLSRDVSRDYRILTHALDAADISQPIHLRYAVNDRPAILDAATQLGALLIDGIGDSIQIDGSKDAATALNLSYGILQAARTRISKTEFIACPSCGRTQFNLQDVTARIKERTAHLKGLKIAIMGCIVNGPGEMADADFGYVGTGTGKISLYVGKDCVERNIPEAGALDNLVALIRSHGKWVENSRT